MLAHTLAVLGLVGYAFEVYRTVRNFNVHRGGLVGAAIESSAAHMAMAVLLACIALFGLGGLDAVPGYVGPIALLISLAYFVAAFRHRQRRARNRQEKTSATR